MILPNRILMVTLSLCFLASCVSVTKKSEIKNTPLGKPVISRVPEGGPQQVLSARIVTNPDGTASGIVINALQRQNCRVVESTPINQTETLTREMTERGKLATGAFWAVGIVGVALLTSAIAMGGPYTEDVAPSETDTDTESNSLPTASGGLLIGGAIATPFLIPAVINSAAARDTTTDLGKTSLTRDLGPTTCDERPSANQSIVVFKNDINGNAAFSVPTDGNGDAFVDIRFLIDRFCPDVVTDTYIAQGLTSSINITSMVHVYCSNANAVEAEKQARIAFRAKMDMIRYNISTRDYTAVRNDLLAATPVDAIQAEEKTAVTATFVEAVLSEPIPMQTFEEVNSSRLTLETIDGLLMTAKQERIYKNALKRSDERQESLEREKLARIKRENQRRLKALVDEFRAYLGLSSGQPITNADMLRGFVKDCDRGSAESCFYGAQWIWETDKDISDNDRAMIVLLLEKSCYLGLPAGCQLRREIREMRGY